MTQAEVASHKICYGTDILEWYVLLLFVRNPLTVVRVMKKEEEKLRQADSNADKGVAQPNRKYTVMDRLNFVDQLEEKNYMKRMQEALQMPGNIKYVHEFLELFLRALSFIYFLPLFTTFSKRASVKVSTSATAAQLGSKAKMELVPHWCIVNEEQEEERLWDHYRKNESLYVWVTFFFEF